MSDIAVVGETSKTEVGHLYCLIIAHEAVSRSQISVYDMLGLKVFHTVANVYAHAYQTSKSVPGVHYSVFRLDQVVVQ